MEDLKVALTISDQSSYMVSIIGWEAFEPLFVADDFDVAKTIVERIVAKRGVPDDSTGYCVTHFENGVAKYYHYYQCEEDDIDNPKWRKPKQSNWSWDKPYPTRVRENAQWWERFVKDSGIGK